MQAEVLELQQNYYKSRNISTPMNFANKRNSLQMDEHRFKTKHGRISSNEKSMRTSQSHSVLP